MEACETRMKIFSGACSNRECEQLLTRSVFMVLQHLRDEVLAILTIRGLVMYLCMEQNETPILIFWSL